MKAFDKKTSVLQYLVKLVKQNDKTLINFKDEILLVESAVAIHLDSLSGDLNVLRSELVQVYETAKAEAGRLLDDNKAPTLSVNVDEESDEDIKANRESILAMEEFAIQAITTVQDTTMALEKTEKQYAKLLEYFGEDENMASSDFFGTMNRFVIEFAKAVEEVEKQEKLRIREQARSTKKTSTTSTTPKNVSSLSLQKQLHSKKKQYQESTTSPHNNIAATAAAAALKKRNQP